MLAGLLALSEAHCSPPPIFGNNSPCLLVHQAPVNYNLLKFNELETPVSWTQQASK